MTAELSGSDTPDSPPVPLRVLIVEDEPAHAELMVRELRRAGYAPEWRRVDTEAGYLECLVPPPELILSDYAMPQFGAPRALELLGARELDVPFIVVSGTIGEEVAVEMIRSGATDYLLKDRLRRLGVSVKLALEQARLRGEKERDARRLRALTENSYDAIAVVNADGIVLYASPSIHRVLGRAPEEIVGQRVFDLMAPEHVAEAQKQYAALVQSANHRMVTEQRVRHKDGTWRWVESVRSNLLADPSVNGIVINFHDITARKEAEDEIRRRAAHLKSLNAIISSTVSANDLFLLLGTTMDETLKALKCAVGGIWAGDARVVRGIPQDVAPSFLSAVESAGRHLLGPDAVADWLIPTGRGAETLGPVMERFDIRASVLAPIQADGRVIGGISVASAGARAWLPDEVMLVEVVGKQIGEAVERLKLSQETQRRTAELEAFYDIGRRLREAQSVDEMYPAIVEHAMQLLAAEHGALALLNAERDTLTRAYTVGIPSETPGSTLPVAGTRSGHVVRTGAAFVTRDSSSDQLPAFINTSPHTTLGPLVIVPLRSEEEIIGTLGLARLKGQEHHLPFTDVEVRLLEGIAEIAGTAIRRARLHQHLEQSYIEMVLVLARAADARDSYTADHSERIAARAVVLARALGCDETELQNIYWGALLHDIGKLGVPDDILRKPGPLTEAEWQIMRQHPVIGEEILRPVGRMHEVASLVRHHQERWDGAGYPDRLQGEEIPLGARILAVVDTYGAMIDNRAYGKGRTTDEAVTEIRRCAGTQFDPHVVEVFCRSLGEESAAVKVSMGRDAQSEIPAIPPSETAVTRALSPARRVGRVVPAMADVARRLLQPHDLTVVLDEILTQIQEIFGYPLCAVLFVDEETRELHVKAQRGYDPDTLKRLRLRPGGQGVEWVARQGRPYHDPNINQDLQGAAGAPVVRSQVAYPLIVNDRVFGVLNVESPMADAFPKEIRGSLEAFAVLASLAILRAQRDEVLHRLALTDGLTGLANHRALWDALEREAARTTRTPHAVSVVLVEIDQFKQVNDRFGHLHGDLVLKLVADVLRRNCRTMDFVARFGGDEFVLLLPNTEKQAACQIAERVRSHVEEIRPPGGQLTVSVGLASLPEDGETAKALMEAADRAMYRVKHAGGNRVSVA